MSDKKFKFHAVNEAAVTQFNKALADEAGQFPGHGTPFLLDELGHWKFDKANYIGGSDPITSGKSSIGFESTIKIKKDGD